uniref:Putative coilin n=1 Tax=Linum usitatissimum TaxID=4006 RepID=G8GJ79_LINUS|nr:putative coilin [Linum usitatissimum]
MCGTRINQGMKRSAKRTTVVVMVSDDASAPPVVAYTLLRAFEFLPSDVPYPSSTALAPVSGSFKPPPLILLPDGALLCCTVASNATCSRVSHPTLRTNWMVIPDSGLVLLCCRSDRSREVSLRCWGIMWRVSPPLGYEHLLNLLRPTWHFLHLPFLLPSLTLSLSYTLEVLSSQGCCLDICQGRHITAGDPNMDVSPQAILKHTVHILHLLLRWTLVIPTQLDEGTMVIHYLRLMNLALLFFCHYSGMTPS